MKEELIEKLFNEFEKNKEKIKQNLLTSMDVIVLQAKDDFSNEGIRLVIHYTKD